MSFRARLSLLFVTTMTALVVATSIATYLIVRSNLHANARSQRMGAGEECGVDRGRPRGVARPDSRAGSENLAHERGRQGNRTQLHHRWGRLLSQPTLKRRWPALPATRPRRSGRGGGGGYAVVLLANSAIESSLSTLFSTLIVVGLAVIAASAVLGVLLARRALRPVERMRRQADAIPGDELDRRLTEGRPDELGRLAAAFNRLLARVERANDEQRRFVADASHELRTPVTALHGHARIVARAAQRGDLDQVHESAAIVATESERLTRTLAELLSLADAEHPEPASEPVRLDQVVAEACDEMRAVHDGRRIETRLANVTVTGDAGRLGELARILIDNALKYSPADQPVTVTVKSECRPPDAVCA